MRLFLVLLLPLALSGAGREVAITIDDLPRGGDTGEASFEATRAMTAKLLAPFRSAKLPVTGFINECRHPDNLRELLLLWKAAGAELGNHTCSHKNLNAIPVAEYLADILPGEKVTTEVRGSRPRYFRHPFLRAGKDKPTRDAVESFLKEHAYAIAPVTLDTSDYMFAKIYQWALEHNAAALARRTREAYLPYMESIFDFFEKRSAEVAGHEIRQVLLIHANQLNADAMPALLGMMKGRGYRVVTLSRALEDPAYQLADEYYGTGGFSWIHRWSKTKGMPPAGEPDPPAWVDNGWREPEKIGRP